MVNIHAILLDVHEVADNGIEMFSSDAQLTNLGTPLLASETLQGLLTANHNLD